MEYPSRTSSGGHGATRPYASTAPHEDGRGAHIDLNLARMTGANVLLVGPERRIQDLVSIRVRETDTGLVIRCQDGPPQLPPASPHVESMVLRDVDCLTPREQRRLFEWLATSNRTQVVSTASAPLLPLVEARVFNDALYYRLNTVYIDLSE